MYNRLLDYVNTNNILSPNQFGFREKHSTYIALLKLIDDISEEINNKTFLLTFSSTCHAFDAINHDILIKTFNGYGIRSVALEWFKNYLTNRLQCVSINCTDASFLPTTCGVPQCSIFGPFLFILYINDIISTYNLAKFILFADDTNLIFKHNDLETLINMINTDIVKIVFWFKINKLSLNIKKANFIIFSPKRKFVPPNNLHLLIDNVPIEQVAKTKFLRIVINSKLNWNDHMTTLCTKVSKIQALFLKVRHNLNKNTVLLFCRSFIQSYLDYCNIIWATGHSNNLERLFRKQKALRAITFTKWNAHTTPHFKHLKLLTVYDINKFENFMLCIQNC